MSDFVTHRIHLGEVTMLRNFLIRSFLTVGLFASTWAYSVTDEVSYGNIRDVVSTHLHLELSVDFKAKQLTGHVEHLFYLTF